MNRGAAPPGPGNGKSARESAFSREEDRALENSIPFTNPQPRRLFGIKELTETLPENFVNLQERATDEEKPTRTQGWALLKFHVSSSQLSRQTADLVLAALEYRQKAGLASIRQVARLRLAGHANPQVLTFWEALALIKELHREDHEDGGKKA